MTTKTVYVTQAATFEGIGARTATIPKESYEDALDGLKHKEDTTITIIDGIHPRLPLKFSKLIADKVLLVGGRFRTGHEEGSMYLTGPTIEAYRKKLKLNKVLKA